MFQIQIMARNICFSLLSPTNNVVARVSIGYQGQLQI